MIYFNIYKTNLTTQIVLTNSMYMYQAASKVCGDVYICQRYRFCLWSYGLSIQFWNRHRFLVGFVLLDLQVYVDVLQVVVCPIVLFAMVLSVLLRSTDSGYPFGIFTLFLRQCGISYFSFYFLFTGQQVSQVVTMVTFYDFDREFKVYPNRLIVSEIFRV